MRLRNVSITLDVLRPTFQPSKEDLEDTSGAESEDITARDANVKAVFSSVQTHWDLIAGVYKQRVRELLERLNDYRSLGDKRSFEKYARSHMKSGRWSEMKGERSLEEEDVKSRKKRGACTGQTGLFGILFGIAYQPNIDCVNQELERFRYEPLPLI